MAIEYFNAYHSYLKSIEPLNDAERGRLFTALLEYSSTGVSPDLRGNERFIFPMMKEQIDRDKSKYEAKCKRQAENASMRWHATACHGMPTDAKHAKEKEKAKTKEKTKANNNTPLPPLEGVGEDLQKAFSDWLKYKSERNEPYKPMGLQSLQTQIKNNANRYGEAAVAELIRRCMASGWKGIIFEQLEKKLLPAGNALISGSANEKRYTAQTRDTRSEQDAMRLYLAKLNGGGSK